MQQTLAAPTIHDMGTKRGERYPSGRFAAWLREAVNQKMADSATLNSESAISRYLGHPERSRMNKWLNRELLPREEDIPVLASKLDGDEATIREAIMWDRLDAFAEDEGMDRAFLHRLAARVAIARGSTKAQLQKDLARVKTARNAAPADPKRPSGSR